MVGGRVGVVGGSIAGCAAALAATRIGADEVVVFERAAARLEERGVGLALHNDRYAELAAAGYLDASIPWIQLTRRPWVVRDDASRGGREIGVLQLPFRSYSWGSLWEELRHRVPERVDYRTGAQVARVSRETGGAVVHLADGTEERFDLVIGADGYRSVVRAAMHPGAVAEYGGFVVWRGTLPAERLPDPAEAFHEEDAATVGFPGGHLLSYRIPGSGGGGTTVNWVFYATPPDTVVSQFADPQTVQPRLMSDELRRYHLRLVADHLPPFWQEVVRRTQPEDTFVQPMYDMVAPSYALGRLVLLGDAAAVGRPNTGSGAVKALQDAAALERALRADDSWESALETYGAERVAVGRATVELGRRLGRAQVTHTPDWAAMDQQALDHWWGEASGAKGFGGYEMRR
ncbi:FAD-dependent monooxygenase [Streptomyces sp. NPDC087263]|uniref:FAD-dependent monooxygenase n=1 Tax=Streptomyces sp. NPDC087263 TaxID=3365773 RepID=UPI00381469E6